MRRRNNNNNNARKTAEHVRKRLWACFLSVLECVCFDLECVRESDEND